MSIQSDSVSGLAVGAVVADTYKVVRLIGKGGMGAVWEADHQRLPGKKVAIKVLNADISQDAEQLARFRREAEIASRLGHPNIVSVNDFNTLADGAPYLVLELLHGEGLDERLARGPMSWDETVHVTRQIGSALAAAHDQGVVHRDLKPQNVFLCPTDVGGDLIVVAKVLDFGISKIRGSQTIKTQEQTLLGTPQYMSPEQATGAHSQIDQRTDLFALAAMVYEMLAGQPAFSGNNVPEVLFKVVYEPVTPLVERAAGIPGSAVAAIEKALSKKPEERFDDVATFIEALTGRPLGTFRGSSKIPAAVAGGPAAPNEKVATAETQHATGSGPAPDAARLATTLDDDATAATVASGAHDKDALPAPASVASKRGTVDPNLQMGLDATVASTGRGTPTPIPGPVGAAAAHPAATAASGKRRAPWLVGGAIALAALAVIGLVLAGSGDSDEPARAPRASATAPAAAPGAGQQTPPVTDFSAARPQDDQGAAPRPEPDEEVAPMMAPPELGDAPGRNAGRDDEANGNDTGHSDDNDAPAGDSRRAHAGSNDGSNNGKGNSDGSAGPNTDKPAPTGTDPSLTRRRSPRVERRGAPARDERDSAPDDTEEDDAPAADTPPELAKALTDALATYRAGNFSAARLAAQRTIYKRPTPMAYAIVTMSYCGMRDLGNARANFRKVGRWKRRVRRQCRTHGLDL